MRKPNPYALAFAWPVIVLALGACATTSTKKIALDPAEVRAEEATERQIVLQTHIQEQRRLSRVAFPILREATPLCGTEVRNAAGFLFDNIESYKGEWLDAAREGLGLGDTLQVIAVADGSPADRAGLRAGDRLLRIQGSPVPTGKGAAKEADKLLNEVSESADATLTLGVERDGEPLALVMDLVEVCRYPAIVYPSSALNAFADGKRIYVTESMMRFANDKELAVIVSHEMAHNAMGHIKAKKKNALFGALLGAVADIATSAASGYNTQGAYSTQAANLGAQAFSQDFETEADYVGLYALALAGLDLEGAANFWRRMAQVSPESIALAGTHPTTVARFLRMEKTIAEIHRKQETGEPLRPDLKGGREEP